MQEVEARALRSKPVPGRRWVEDPECRCPEEGAVVDLPGARHGTCRPKDCSRAPGFEEIQGESCPQIPSFCF